MSIPLLVILLYVIILYSVAFYSTKMLKKGGNASANYLLAGKSLPAILVAVMITGLAIGGASTVGVAEDAYQNGMSATMYHIPWAVAAIIIGLIFAKRFRKMNVSTIPEMIRVIFGETSGTLAVIIQIASLMGITALQYKAGGSILTSLLPQYFDIQTGMLTTVFVFMGITVIGGYWAASLSNLINVIVIYLGLSIGGITLLNDIGGFSEVVASLPEGDFWFDPVKGVGSATVAAWWISGMFSKLPNQSVIQSAFAAKNPEESSKGYILAGILIIPPVLISGFLGIMAVVKYPGLENATLALPTIILSLSPWIAGLVLSGLWAADISTASALLIGGSTMVMRDIYQRYFNRNLAQDKEIKVSRIVVFGFAVIAYFLATKVSSILGVLSTLTSIFTPYTFIMILMFFYPKLLRRSTAFWSILASLVILLLWLTVPATRIVPHIAYLQLPVSIVLILLIPCFDKRSIDVSSVYMDSVEFND